MARNTLALFGSEMDIEQTNMIVLENTYPHIKVTALVKRDMTTIIRETKKDASYIFRKLIQVLIPDLEVWAESSGVNDMHSKFKYEIGAAYGPFVYINSNLVYIIYKKCFLIHKNLSARAVLVSYTRNAGTSFVKCVLKRGVPLSVEKSPCFVRNPSLQLEEQAHLMPVTQAPALVLQVRVRRRSKRIQVTLKWDLKCMKTSLI